MTQNSGNSSKAAIRERWLFSWWNVQNSKFGRRFSLSKLLSFTISFHCFSYFHFNVFNQMRNWLSTIKHYHFHIRLDLCVHWIVTIFVSRFDWAVKINAPLNFFLLLFNFCIVVAKRKYFEYFSIIRNTSCSAIHHLLAYTVKSWNFEIEKRYHRSTSAFVTDSDYLLSCNYFIHSNAVIWFNWLRSQRRLPTIERCMHLSFVCWFVLALMPT